MLGGMYFKYYVTENLIRTTYQRQAEDLANSFTFSIWNRYYPVVGYLADKPPESYKTYAQYLVLEEEAKKFFVNNKIIKAAIHIDNNILYKSNDNYIKEKPSLSNFWLSANYVQKALETAKTTREPVSLFIPSATVNDGSPATRAIVKVYIPIAPQHIAEKYKDYAGKVNAVLEINYNVNQSLKTTEMVQYTSVIFIICCFGAITVGVFIAAMKSEKVLEKQQEATAELLAARTSAETESKEKSKFLANISHELRTPLNAIIGFSEIISTESMGPINNEQYKEFVKDIHTSGLHLLSLINDILDYSKAEEGKLEAIMEEVDLTKIVKSSLKMVLPRAEQAKVLLKDLLPEEHIVLIADGKRLKQVLLNLLSNAVKFTPESGTVTVKAWKNLDLRSVIVEVIDTGVGMEPQDIAKAMAIFGQVDNKLSRRYDGTGLGLPLTKKLVEIMKGKFEIKSEVGLGTTVTITFPMPNEQNENGNTI
jgi:two-component system cell cycle sensor histidine kinase PleC